MAQEVFVACSDDDLGCRCALFRLLFIEGRRPGVRPGGRGTFLCFAKAKYPKERRPEVRATSWLAALKQTRGLIPLALRCSALPHGKSGIGCGRACEGTDEISHAWVSNGAGG